MSVTVVRNVVAGACALAMVVSTVEAQTPTITVGGLGYAQYNYNLHQDSVTGAHLNAFTITRAYINVVGKFPIGVGARITPDIYQNADGSLTYRLKYAYATYTPENSPLTFKFGQTQTPWLDWEEALWDYRMQGTMALERFTGPNGSYLSSSDFGAAIDGNIKYDQLNFQVGVYNGESYRSPEGDNHKDAMARVSVRVLNTDDHSRVGGLRVTGYGQIGAPTGGGKRNRYVGMVSYRSKLFTLAGEYARVEDQLDKRPPATGAPVPLTKGDIFSAFGVLNIPNTRAALIGRVDIQKPNTAVADNKQTRFIAGASYQVNQNLRVLADIDNLALQSGVYTNAIQSTRTQGLFQMQIAF